MDPVPTSRGTLRNVFSDGETPDGGAFANLFESFLNVIDDQVSVDADSNLVSSGGVTIGNTANGPAGTLRFNGGQLEIFDGGAFQPVGGGGGAFTSVNGSTNVAYQGGNVGIGNFPNPPAHRLDVNLGANTGQNERVRFGQLVVHNGQGNDGAYISHSAVAGNPNSYALRQDSQGNTTINSPANTQLIFQHNGATRFQVLSTGNVEISPDTSLSIRGNTAIGAPGPGNERNLLVFGNAQKTIGGPFDPIGSDARMKQDIRPLEHGLAAICKLEPVYYKFKKGLGLQRDQSEHIGLTAQNIKEHLPFLVKTSEVEDEKGEKSYLTYSRGPIEFIMINAIKELAQKVETLEETIKKLQKK